MAKNLVEELGAGYVGEWFSGALFARGDTLYILRSASAGELQVHKLGLDDPEDGWMSSTLPASTLESFNDISWPKLGYRNLLAGAYGNTVSFITAQRSVMRGLRHELLEWKSVDAVSCLGINPWGHMPSADQQYQLRQIFRPTFHSYALGMAQIRAGKWCSFAINEDIAISLSNGVSHEFCEILFRDKVVGNIDQQGELTLSNKVFKRGNLSRLFSETQRHAA